MKLWVGVTDKNWFEFLALHQPDEVNFWQPGGATPFRVLESGELFLFKLKHPYNAIVGGGFLVKHAFLPLSIAWDAFGRNNGLPDYFAFRDRIIHYRGASRKEPDPTIGCIILTEPFFFPEKDWIPQPADWGKSIVQGKSYDLTAPAGRTLYEQVQTKLQMSLPAVTQEISNLVRLSVDQNEHYRLGQTKHRLGQGAFRTMVTEAYNRRCAATAERIVPVLIAGHIKPYAKSGPHHVNNGILLRSDLHTLFDLGYITITPSYDLEVSPRIKEEYQNGKEYYVLHGKRIALPAQELQYPSQDYLAWHNENVYVP